MLALLLCAWCCVAMVEKESERETLKAEASHPVYELDPTELTLERSKVYQPTEIVMQVGQPRAVNMTKLEKVAAEAENYKLANLVRGAELEDLKEELDKLKVQIKTIYDQILKQRVHNLALFHRVDRVDQYMSNWSKEVQDAKVEIAKYQTENPELYKSYLIADKERRHYQVNADKAIGGLNALKNKSSHDIRTLDNMVSQMTSQTKLFKALFNLNAFQAQRMSRTLVEMQGTVPGRLTEWSCPMGPRCLLMSRWSKSFFNNGGYQVSKDMQSNQLGGGSGPYYWIDGGGNTMNGWGNFKIRDVTNNVETFLPLFATNTEDGVINSNEFYHNQGLFKVTYGWATRGIFMIEARQVGGYTQEFILLFGGKYGSRFTDQPTVSKTTHGIIPREIFVNGHRYMLYTYWNNQAQSDRPQMTYTVVPFSASMIQDNSAKWVPDANSPVRSRYKGDAEDVAVPGLRHGATLYIQWGMSPVNSVQEWITYDLQEGDRKPSINDSFVEYVPVTPSNIYKTESFRVDSYFGAVVSCRATLVSLINGESSQPDGKPSGYSLQCPPFCGDLDQSVGVFGNGSYTQNSAICRSAMHAGMLPRGQQGSIRLQVMDSCPDFFPSTASNGFLSESYAGPIEKCFSFIPLNNSYIDGMKQHKPL
eukprot:GILJ01003202.1.p1 GENE.GILJ01003202.1~~GILJ01003202.1.p1  ORF type:complete len:677 (-),score=99.51 GILJ01003202.1:726-2669(-)